MVLPIRWSTHDRLLEADLILEVPRRKAGGLEQVLQFRLAVVHRLGASVTGVRRWLRGGYRMFFLEHIAPSIEHLQRDVAIEILVIEPVTKRLQAVDARVFAGRWAAS